MSLLSDRKVEGDADPWWTITDSITTRKSWLTSLHTGYLTINGRIQLFGFVEPNSKMVIINFIYVQQISSQKYGLEEKQSSHFKDKEQCR